MLLAATAAAIPAAAAASQPTITQSVEPLEVGTDDTATVTVEVHGASGAAQVSLPPSEDFEVVGRSQSSSTSIRADGFAAPTVERSVRYAFTIRPRHEGRIDVPAATVTVDGRTLAGAPTQLDAQPGHVASAAPRPADPFSSFFGRDPFAGLRGGGFGGSFFDRFFGHGPFADDGTEAGEPGEARLFARLDSPSVYAGQQATVSFYVATRGDLSSVGGLRLPAIDGAAAQDLDVPAHPAPTTITIGGRQFQAYLVARRALFPSKAGTLRIPGGSVEVGVGDPFTFSGPTLVRSQPLSLEVKPVPPGGAPGEPVGRWRVSLQSTSEAPPVAGEPIPVQVTVEGVGDLQALEAPTLSVDGPARVHEPTVKDTPQPRRGGTELGGRRTFEFLVTPEHQGHLAVAPVTLAYFDPSTGRHERARSAALDFEVGPAPAAAQASAPAAAVSAADTSGTSSTSGGEAPRPPPTLPAWTLPVAQVAALASLTLAALVAAGLGGRRLFSSKSGAENDTDEAKPSARGLRRRAARGLRGAKVAARAGRAPEAARLVEQALTDAADAAGLDTSRLDADRLARDAGRPAVAEWAQTVLLCRRARFGTMDPAQLDELIARAERAMEALAHAPTQPGPPAADVRGTLEV